MNKALGRVGQWNSLIGLSQRLKCVLDTRDTIIAWELVRPLDSRNLPWTYWVREPELLYAPVIVWNTNEQEQVASLNFAWTREKYLVLTQQESLGKEWGRGILPTCVDGGQRWRQGMWWMLSGYRTVGHTPRKVWLIAVTMKLIRYFRFCICNRSHQRESQPSCFLCMTRKIEDSFLDF